MVTLRPEMAPPKFRDGEHIVATNMRCDECRKRLDTNLECNSGLCRQCDDIAYDPLRGGVGAA